MKWYLFLFLFMLSGFSAVVFEPVCPLVSNNGFIKPEIKAGVLDQELTCYETSVYFKIGNKTHPLTKTNDCVFTEYVPVKDALYGEYIANISGTIKTKTCPILLGNLEIDVLWPKNGSAYYSGEKIQVSALLLFNNEPVKGTLKVNGIVLTRNHLGIYSGEVPAEKRLVFSGEYNGVSVTTAVFLNITEKKNTSIKKDAFTIKMIYPKENETLYVGQTLLFKAVIQENGLITTEPEVYLLFDNETVKLKKDRYGVYYKIVTIPNTTSISLRILTQTDNVTVTLPIHIVKRNDVDVIKSGIKLEMIPVPNTTCVNSTISLSMKFQDIYENILLGDVKIEVYYNGSLLEKLSPIRHVYYYQFTYAVKKPGDYSFRIYFNNTLVREIQVKVLEEEKIPEPLAIKILSPQPGTYELEPINIYIQVFKEGEPFDNATVILTDGENETLLENQGNGRYFTTIEPRYGDNEFTVIARYENTTGMKVLSFSTSTKHLEIHEEFPVEANITLGEPLEGRIILTSENQTIPNAYVIVEVAEPSGRSVEAKAYETTNPGEYYTLFYPNVEGDYHIKIRAEKEGYIPAQKEIIVTVRFPEEKIIVTKNTLLSIILILALISLGYVVLKALF